MRRSRPDDKKKAASWSITDGREAIGWVELQGEQYVAILPNHSVVGRYPTLAQAMEAFNRRRAHGGGDAPNLGARRTPSPRAS